MRERVIAEYHELLLNDEPGASELFARLEREMIAMRLLYGQSAVRFSTRECHCRWRRHGLLRFRWRLKSFSNCLIRAGLAQLDRV